MPVLSALVACLGLLLAAERARAAPRDTGTHAIAELEGGALLSGKGGPALRAALGIGGKWRGFPARFYLVGHFGASGYVAEPPESRAQEQSSEEGAFYDFALGPRVYWPIIGPLRLFVEALAGATLASANHVEYGRSSLSASEWLLLAQASAGLQWRLLYQLSVGARVSVTLNESGLTGVARYAGVHDRVRSALTAGVTWHF